jgi:hypothetical protein
MRRLGPLIYCFLLLGCVAVGKSMALLPLVRKIQHISLCTEKISTFHGILRNFIKRKHPRKGEKKGPKSRQANSPKELMGKNKRPKLMVHLKTSEPTLPLKA